jgi:type II secretory pathway pseudopilin PulG
MKKYRAKYGVTMIEVMVSVAVVIALVSVAIGVSTYVRQQGRMELAKSEIAILSTALEQYYDYTHQYPPDVNYTDESDLPSNGRINAFKIALNTNDEPHADNGSPLRHYGFSNDSPYSGIEVLYYYLNRIPQSRNLLKKLPEKAITAKAIKLDTNNQPIKNTAYDPNLIIDLGPVGNQKLTNVIRIIDPWETPFKYTRYRSTESTATLKTENKNFPLIESAGPDRKFHTVDDITSRDN